MKSAVVSIALFLGLNGGVVASAAADPLASVGFLVGNWTSRAPEGTDRFTRELDGHVIVRTSNSASSPRRGQIPMRSAMTIYADTDGTIRAMYFDNEGHALRYKAARVDAAQVQFVSEGAESEPRFRLTYAMQAKRAMKVTFEIAGPQDPAAFRVVAQAIETRSAH
jgi:hypothetical protein